MIFTNNELYKSDSYVAPDIQVLEISVEQNVLDSGSSLGDFGGEDWYNP